jgi:hypothetical protein
MTMKNKEFKFEDQREKKRILESNILEKVDDKTEKEKELIENLKKQWPLATEDFLKKLILCIPKIVRR